MKKLWKYLVTTLLIVGMTATLTGCGGQEKAATEGEKKTETTKPKISIGSDTAYSPFEFQDPKTNQYIGFDMDLIDAIAKEAGFDYEIKSMNFDGVIAAVQTGNVDAAISAMTITEKRAKTFDFSEPYFDANQSVAVKADNQDIKAEADLKGKKIAVQIGTTGADYAKKLTDEKLIKTFNTINEAFLELKNGGVDAVVNDFPVTAYFIQQGNPDIKVTFEIKTGESYGIAVNKNKKDVLEMMNKGLKAVKESGQYDQIYQKWFGK